MNDSLVMCMYIVYILIDLTVIVNIGEGLVIRCSSSQNMENSRVTVKCMKILNFWNWLLFYSLTSP